MNSNILIVDDSGMPIASMNPDQLQNDGADLAFRLAAHCGNEERTQQTLAQAITQHGTDSIGYVLTAAIRLLTDDILAGAFDVMAMTPGVDPRAKMAEIGGVKSP